MLKNELYPAGLRVRIKIPPSKKAREGYLRTGKPIQWPHGHGFAVVIGKCRHSGIHASFLYRVRPQFESAAPKEKDNE